MTYSYIKAVEAMLNPDIGVPVIFLEKDESGKVCEKQKSKEEIVKDIEEIIKANNDPLDTYRESFLEAINKKYSFSCNAIDFEKIFIRSWDSTSLFLNEGKSSFYTFENLRDVIWGEREEPEERKEEKTNLDLVDEEWLNKRHKKKSIIDKIERYVEKNEKKFKAYGGEKFKHLHKFVHWKCLISDYGNCVSRYLSIMENCFLNLPRYCVSIEQGSGLNRNWYDIDGDDGDDVDDLEIFDELYDYISRHDLEGIFDISAIIEHLDENDDYPYFEYDGSFFRENLKLLEGLEKSGRFATFIKESDDLLYLVVRKV